MKSQKEYNDNNGVSIVNYQPKFQFAFRDLNVEWISAYFKMEPSDYKALDNPQTYIIDNGGLILVALYNDQPVGVCALIKMEDPDYQYDLAKMAVSPKMQGKKIGWLIGQAIVSKAKESGASAIYLETNSILKPAIGLYEKLGFRHIQGRKTPYQRCNVQMELVWR